MQNDNLRIDNPCPFLLQRMNKQGDDFYCKSCNKTIIDFRNKSAEEIRCAATADFCGIFTTDQLPGQQRMSFFRQLCFIALMIMSFLGFSVKPMQAQTRGTTPAKKSNVEVKKVNKFADSSLTDKSKNAYPASSEKWLSKKQRKEALKRKDRRVWLGCPSF